MIWVSLLKKTIKSDSGLGMNLASIHKTIGNVALYGTNIGSALLRF
jgi:hypothetical protein